MKGVGDSTPKAPVLTGRVGTGAFARPVSEASAPQQHFGRRTLASSNSRRNAAYASLDDATPARFRNRAYAASSKISRNAAMTMCHLETIRFILVPPPASSSRTATPVPALLSLHSEFPTTVSPIPPAPASPSPPALL